MSMTAVFIHVSRRVAAGEALRTAVAERLQSVGMYELPRHPRREMDATERAAYDAKRAARRAKMWSDLEAAGVRPEDLLGVYDMNFVGTSKAFADALSSRRILSGSEDSDYGPVILLEGNEVAAVANAADPPLRDWLVAHSGPLIFGIY